MRNQQAQHVFFDAHVLDRGCNRLDKEKHEKKLRLAKTWTDSLLSPTLRRPYPRQRRRNVSSSKRLELEIIYCTRLSPKSKTLACLGRQPAAFLRPRPSAALINPATSREYPRPVRDQECRSLQHKNPLFAQKSEGCPYCHPCTSQGDRRTLMTA